MRTTNSMLVNNMLYYVNKNLGRMEAYQAQMATGKKIQVPSDDPVVAARALKFRTDVSEVTQYKDNANDASSWMDTTEGALGKMVDYLQTVHEKGVYAGNIGTMSDADRDAIAQEIKQIRDEFIHLSNTSYAGRYVFSGYTTDQKLLNDDGTYNITVSSNETMAVKGNTLSVSAASSLDTTGKNTFRISLNNGTYFDVSITEKAYDGQTGNTLDDLARDIQTAVNAADTSLKDIQVKNNAGRLEIYTNNSIDQNGNKIKIYIQDDSAQPGALENLGIQTDPVTGKVVSKQEDINYQVGVGDLLNVNVLGTSIFGSGAKGDMGDYMVKLSRLIDSLSISDGNSYIISQELKADSDNSVDLTVDNKFSVKVDGMGGFVDISLNAVKYDGTPGKDINSLAADMQAKIQTAAGSATIKVENRNGKLYIYDSTGKSITFKQSGPGENALNKLKLYTDSDQTLTSATRSQGITKGTDDAKILLDRVLSVRADIGARMNRADLTVNRLEDEEINFTKIMSENEDIDMAEVITKLQMEENVYRSSLAAGARIIMPTLIDFLK